MDYLRIPAKSVKDIIKATFPDYKKREVIVKATEKVTFYDVNWSGGTKAEYRACAIDGTTNGRIINMGRYAPWNNPFEGLTVDLPVDCVIVEGGYFCGKERNLYLHVHPANMPKMIAA